MSEKPIELYRDNYSDFINTAREIIFAADDKAKFAVLYVDITGFQLVNDFYGFAEGNRFLAELEKFMSEFPRTQICSRVFSDHFLRLAKFYDGLDLFELTSEYEKKFNEFLVHQRENHLNCKLSISGGFCVVNNGASGLIKAIDDANLARKEAKIAQRTIVMWFDDEMRERIKNRKNIEIEIQSALIAKEFCFYLQPKVNLHTGKVIGAEALARWIKKDGTIIYPNDFIPIMEENQSITELDLLIYRQVCKYLKKRIMDNAEPIPISVNISRMHIYQSNVASRIHAIAVEYQIPPELLEFELTETVLLDEFDSAKQIMDELRNYGYKTSIDDFGSGFTGINIWKKLNFDIVKLDRNFIELGEVQPTRNDTVISSIVFVGKKMRTVLICEGVETMEQGKHMRDLGCDAAQGYVFSRPVPPDDFEKILESNGGYYTFPWSDETLRPVKESMYFDENIVVDNIESPLKNLVPCDILRMELDDKGKILDISSTCCEILGCRKKDILDGLYYSDFVIKEDLSRFQREINEINEKKRSYVEHKIINNNDRIIKIVLYPVKTAGTEHKIIGDVMLFDVTESQNKVKKDSIMNTFYKQVYDMADCAIVLYKESTKRKGAYQCIDLNRYAMEVFGFSDKESAVSEGTDIISDFILPEDIIEYVPILSRMREPGDSAPLKFRIKRLDGEIRQIMGTLKLFIDNNGNKYFLGVLLDNTNQEIIDELKEKFNTVVENTDGNVLTIKINKYNNDVSTRYFTTGLAKTFGYTNEKLRAILAINNGLGLVYEGDHEMITREILKRVSRRENLDISFRVVYKNGHIGWNNLSASFNGEDKEGNLVYHGSVIDISRFKAQESAMMHLEAKHKLAIEIACLDIWSYDFRTKKLSLPLSERFSGLALNGRTEIELTDFLENGNIHPDYISEYKNMYDRMYNGEEQSEAEVLARVNGGKYEWIKLIARVVSWNNGKPEEFVAIATNINEHKIRQEQYKELQNKILRDSLTGIFNRSAAESMIKEELENMLDDGLISAFLIMDIDNFKEINDTMGHQTGDSVLSNIVSVINSVIPENSIFGRLGGDEFILFVRGVYYESDIYKIAKVICSEVNRIQVDSSNKLQLSVSIGIAFANKNSSFEQLYKRADIAMYKIKNKSKNNFGIYSEN